MKSPGDDDVFDWCLVDSDNPDAPFPPTYMVLCFAPDANPRAISWLVSKIIGSRENGGAELLVRRQPTGSDQDPVILHITASCRKLLEVAEDMELKKRDLRTGIIRDFLVAHLSSFLEEGQSPEDLLTTAERQIIVRHELENIRALDEDHKVPGYPKLRMYEGQSVVELMLQDSLITSMYPLHDKEALKRLSTKWLWSKYQPVEDIRQYFGEALALYFKFLDFYTLKLIFPLAVFGTIQMILSTTETLPFFCVCNIIAVIIFLEVWRRKSNESAFLWGTINMSSLDEPRSNYHGTMMVDTVSGKLLPQFPRRITNFRMYCGSFPIVLVCLFLAFLVMLASFRAEEMVAEKSKDPESGVNWIVVRAPSVIYTLLVTVVNLYYRKLATYLTEWENHRTQSQFERHRVIKLVAFEFVNTFMALFYIAFVYQDMEMLRSQLMTMLVIQQLFCNLQEVVMPLLTRVFSKVQAPAPIPDHSSVVYPDSEKNSSGLRHRGSVVEPYGPEVLQSIPVLDDPPRVLQALEEGAMEVYECTYDDYLELFLQFGHVTLFSAVYPIAALFALINNVIESRVDALKLCQYYQRPLARRVKDTGAWQRAFEALGAMAIMTNCGLLCVSEPLRQRLAPDMVTSDWLFRWVVAEHLLLVVRYILHQAIPDKPEWVRVSLAKLNYQSKMALRKQRALQRRLSSRRSPYNKSTTDNY